MNVYHPSCSVNIQSSTSSLAISSRLGLGFLYIPEWLGQSWYKTRVMSKRLTLCPTKTTPRYGQAGVPEKDINATYTQLLNPLSRDYCTVRG